MPAIAHEAHRSEWYGLQEKARLWIPHPCRREVICERGKVCGGAAADRRSKVYR